MRKKIIFLGLALTLIFSIGITAYAVTGGSRTAYGRLGLGRSISMRGADFMTSVLKNLGMSDTDINNARNSGKTLYDIAKDKGITDDQLKSALYEEKAKAIDDAVSKGTITREQGDTLKTNLKSNIDNCPGTSGQGQYNGRGMMGNGQRGAVRGICSEKE